MKKLISILSIVLAFTACNNYKDVDRTNYQITKNINDWGEFNSGSFWIFQNDSTNEIMDTIGIAQDFKTETSPAVTLMEIDPRIDKSKDLFEFQQTILSSKTSGKNDMIFYGNTEVYGNDVIQWSERYYDLDINAFAGIFRINDKGVIEEEFDLYLNHYSIKSIDKLEILGKNYSDIAHVTFKRVDTDNIYQYWISKNNWIIKKVFIVEDKTYSWSLKESIIKQ